MSEGTKVTIYAAPKMLQDMIEELYDTISAGGSELEPVSGGLNPENATDIPPGPIDLVKWAKAGPGWYDFGNGPQEAVAGKSWVIWWNKVSWSLKNLGELPSINVDNLLNKSEILGNSLIQPDSIFIKKNTIIASNGNVGTNTTTYLGSISIVGFPLAPNSKFVLDFQTSNGKTYALADESGVVGIVGTMTEEAKVISTTSSYRFLRVNLKGPDSTEPNDTWSESLMLNEGETLLVKAVTKIESKFLEAKVLSADNITPDPINEKNAINLNYFTSNAILKNEIGLEKSNNLADLTKNIKHKYIGSSGSINPGMYWSMIAIDVSAIPAGTPITFGNQKIQDGGYSAFHNESGLVQNNGGFTNGLLPRTVIQPANATILYIDTARPYGTNEFSKMIVNIGNELIEYVPPALVVSVGGYHLKPEYNPTPIPQGDQEVNKNSSVMFAEVMAGTIKTSSLVLNLPTSPVGLISGRAWIDTANGNVIKVVS